MDIQTKRELKVREIRSEKEIKAFAAEWLLQLAEHHKGGTHVVALFGNLGAGKTTFVQAVARELGVADNVTSPTFVIEKIYQIPKSPSTIDLVFTHLIHIDAYRLDDPNELEKLGWHSLVSDKHNLIMVEWPERIERLLPKDHSVVRFTYVDETTRTVEY